MSASNRAARALADSLHRRADGHSQTINIAFFVGALVLPFATAVYLARRAQRPVGDR
jgi:hypothetical protein